MAYSQDLRKKVIQRYTELEEAISYQKLAEGFGVSYCFVRNLIIRWKKTGSTEVKPHGGGNPGKFNRIKYNWLRLKIAEFPDITLKEIKEAYQQHFYSSISISSINRALKKMKMSTKKKSL